jgi:hypothetical protein
MKPKHTIIAVAVRWFVDAVHRSQKRTKNTASESVASGPKPSDAKPPENSSVPAPRLHKITLSDGEAIADSFFFPFLGTVECFSRTREKPYTTRDGETYNWPIKVFYDRHGKILRRQPLAQFRDDFWVHSVPPALLEPRLLAFQQCFQPLIPHAPSPYEKMRT